MSTVSIQQGILHLPGSTVATKKTAEELLAQDRKDHHCFFNERGFHNHLSHHVLAAYDLGASPELLKAIYAEEGKVQRPILLNQDESITKLGAINDDNWTKYIGQQGSYAAFVQFFEEQSKKLGPSEVVEKYIFSPKATENHMLIRLFAGAVHPFIQLGYAAEFGSDLTLISEALAQMAVHSIRDSGMEVCRYVPSEKKLPLLQVFAEIANNSILEPVMPYDPEAFFFDRIKQAFGPPSKRADELARVCSMWDLPTPFTDADLDRAIEEAVWAATLLFAGTSKAGRKPRLDFFLMHGLTSSLFLRSLCKNIIKNKESQVKLLRHWLATISVIVMIRGRPKIDGNVLMSYSDTPLPPNLPNVFPTPDKAALTPPTASREAFNSWMLLIQSGLRAPDSHTVKSLRALLYGAIHYGTRGAGEAPGALDKDGKEVIPGLKHVDGTIFVRAAGVLMDTLGWVDWGQPVGDWDRSALGWDDAWKNEESKI